MPARNACRWPVPAPALARGARRWPIIAAALALTVCALAHPALAQARTPTTLAQARTPTTTATNAGGAATGDPLRTLIGDSPLCGQALSPVAAAACASSGAPEHAYPLDRYRFDWHIATGLTSFDDNVAAIVQWLVALLWTGVLYATEAVLLVFQWAFSLDLLDRALAPAARAMDHLHRDLVGSAWLIAGVLALGLWAIWNGLARRRAARTLAGLVSAVAMLAIAMAIVARPAETVGAASRAANDLKLDVLAGVATGSLGGPAPAGPTQGVAAASQVIFDTIVLRPWCAIEFGDVAWCLSRAPGDRLTRAQRWLRYDVGSKQRNAEYEVLADPHYRPGAGSTLLGIGLLGVLSGSDAALQAQFAGYRVRAIDRAKIRIQTKGDTLMRAGLVALVSVGIVGWLALVGYLAAQALFQGMLALTLLVGAPVMLLAPTLGDAGRRLFGHYLRRLAAALSAGVVLALLLAIVVAAATAIAAVDAHISWLAGWLIQLIFFWGVFFHRRDLLGWLSGGTHGGFERLSPAASARPLPPRPGVIRLRRPRLL